MINNINGANDTHFLKKYNKLIELFYVIFVKINILSNCIVKFFSLNSHTQNISNVNIFQNFSLTSDQFLAPLSPHAM